MPEGLHAFAGDAVPPRRNGELAFDAPWESRLFGMTAALVEARVFDWADVQRALIATIASWDADPARGRWSYWERWRVALESLLAERGICGPDDVAGRAAVLAARPAGHDHR